MSIYIWFDVWYIPSIVLRYKWISVYLKYKGINLHSKDKDTDRTDILGINLLMFFYVGICCLRNIIKLSEHVCSIMKAQRQGELFEFNHRFTFLISTIQFESGRTHYFYFRITAYLYEIPRLTRILYYVSVWFGSSVWNWECNII